MLYIKAAADLLQHLRLLLLLVCCPHSLPAGEEDEAAAANQGDLDVGILRLQKVKELGLPAGTAKVLHCLDVACALAYSLQHLQHAHASAAVFCRHATAFTAILLHPFNKHIVRAVLYFAAIKALFLRRCSQYCLHVWYLGGNMAAGACLGALPAAVLLAVSR